MGGMGIESLSPMQPAMQPAMQSAMYNPLEENYYSGMPTMMAGGGSAKLVEREQYGLGSVLKKFAKTFIPKELDPVLQIAAPFLGPVYGPIASIAGSARTGKINPLSLASSTLPYLQFGGEGATGLGSFMPVGYGGSGAIELPGGALQLGQKGTSLASSLGKYFDIGSTPYSEQGQGTVSKIFSTINPGSTLTGSERIGNIMDLGRQATDAILYKTDPVTGKQVLDKRAAFSIAMAIPSYLDAKKKADELGLSPNEFNEEIYEREKQFYQNKYASNAPGSSFGIRTTAAGGGMMDDGSGILSIKLTPAQAMAMGGRMGYADGSPLAGLAIKLNRPVQSGDPVGSYYDDRSYPGGDTAIPRPGQYDTSNSAVYVGEGEGDGGMGTLIKQLILNNPNMFQQTQRQARTVSANPVNDLYKYYLENGTDEDYKRRIMESVKPRFGVAMGGEIPVRQNQGGVSELDLRAKGGYIPVGIKEKADDVPAMLSKNEFVFTADAVRGAGGGNINKGAQKMYKLMKSLEKKIIKTKVK
jgi:hypothetical protein